MVTGCIQVPLVAHGNCAISPDIDKLCLGSYWGYWITKSPQQLLDERAQKESGGLVSTSGMFKIEVEQNLLEDLVSVALMGLVVPVSVKCWMQEDVDAHALPVEVEHDRKALNQ